MVEAELTCAECEKVFVIVTDKALEQGEFICPHCGTLWRGKIEVRLTST
jgi:uncharacterized Zn-finger protein